MSPRERLTHALERHAQRLTRRIDTLQARSDALTRWRTLTFIGVLGAALIVYGASPLLAALIVGAGGAGFIALVTVHRRVKEAQARFVALRELTLTHLARQRIDWQKLPPAFAASDYQHPFAADLNIGGEYGLHRLLNTCVSRGGSARLLDWLTTETPPLDVIQQRQTRVQALKPLRAFRDRVTLTARLSGSGGQWDGARLLRWLNEGRAGEVVPRWVLPVLVLLAVTTFILLAVDYFEVLDGAWGASLGLYAVLTVWALLRAGDLFGAALRAKSELDPFVAVLRELESAPVTNPVLRDLLAPFHAGEVRPSVQLKRLNAILAASSLRQNVIFWFMVNLFVPWDVAVASRLGRTQQSLARDVPLWLEAWYELEAHNALAHAAYLNPDDVFPVLDESTVFEADALGHPLIPFERRVTNDFAFAPSERAMLVTGSNMSCKSTFLRTVGLALVLAYAGGAVPARRLTLSRQRLFTCISVSDSVVDGISYFYAEVKRLKALLDAVKADGLPVLYLIDEIFKGTNNRERLIGSRDYIHALIHTGGRGLISTHDLDLTQLADALEGVRNGHFREEVRDGQMVFDYRLRSGPCPTTNALKIMALEGLPINP
jgi:hypothetical protein